MMTSIYIVYYLSFLLYLIGLIGHSTIIFFLLGRTRAEAQQRRMGTFVRWLTPAVIGASLALFTAVLIIAESFLRVRTPLLTAINYLLFVSTVPFSIVSNVRLWEMVRGMPIWTGDLPPAPVPPQEGVWPPPPNVG